MLIFNPRTELRTPIDAYVGAIPFWIDPKNELSFIEQVNVMYDHGGGWRDMPNFTLGPNDALLYPGDAPLEPVAEAKMQGDRILVYPFAIFAVVSGDNKLRVARLD